MRYLIPAAAIVVAMLSAGCCGAGAADPTASAAPAPRARALTDTVATHEGCSLKIGAECGGKVVFGGAVQFPNPLDLLRGLWESKTGTPAPFVAAQAAEAPCAAPSSEPYTVVDRYYADHEGRRLMIAPGQ